MSPRPPRPTTKSWQRGLLAQRGADYFGMSGPTEFIAATAMFGLRIVFLVLNVMRQRAHAIFLKLDRCPIFLDEAGWLEIPAATRLASKVVSSSNAAELALVVR
jgi:hypothetical protein